MPQGAVCVSVCGAKQEATRSKEMCTRMRPQMITQSRIIIYLDGGVEQQQSEMLGQTLNCNVTL